jgi:ankyrin repeat protein
MSLNATVVPRSPAGSLPSSRTDRNAAHRSIDEYDWLSRESYGWMDCTPLVLASREGKVPAVRWLLDNGAPVNERDRAGATALAHASEKGHDEVVRLVLERGADASIVLVKSRTTPLIAASTNGHLEIVRLLLGHPAGKATINQRDWRGQTALWWACFRGHGLVARMLLKGGADHSIADGDGITPTEVAKEEQGDASTSTDGRQECVTALEVRSCHLWYSP